MFTVTGVKFSYSGPEFGGVVHFEKMAVFVDGDVLLDGQGQLGQVNIEIEIVAGGGRAPARAHFFVAHCVDLARGEGFQEQQGFFDDVLRGAAVKLFGENFQLFALLAVAQIIAERGPRGVGQYFQARFFQAVVGDLQWQGGAAVENFRH